MENQKNTGNICGTTASRPKPKKRKNTSTLSARLNPDFDLRKDIKCQRTIQEIESKSLEFDNLIRFLHPLFIFDYLHKILQFLRSAEEEMEFLNMATAYEEEFLLRIAKNTKLLESHAFTVGSRIVARDILGVLMEKRIVIQLLGDRRNAFKYRKEYLGKSQLQPRNIGHLKSLADPHELASELENLKLKENLKLDNRDISPGFKIHLLNMTLKFIRDDNQLTLEYPEMPHDEAAYVYFLIQSCYNSESNIGFGFKSLYSPLCESMNSQNSMYEYKIEFYDCANNKAKVTLKKIPKLVIQLHNLNESQDLNSTSSSATSDNSSRTQKDLSAKKKLIEQLSMADIKEAMNKVLGFVQDDQSASLIFNRVNYCFSRFLRQVTSFARCPYYHELFSADVVILLRQIHYSCTRNVWKLRIELGKTDKSSRLRDVYFYKEPIEKKLPKATKKITRCSETAAKVVDNKTTTNNLVTTKVAGDKNANNSARTKAVTNKLEKNKAFEESANNNLSTTKVDKIMTNNFVTTKTKVNQIAAKNSATTKVVDQVATKQSITTKGDKVSTNNSAITTKVVNSEHSVPNISVTVKNDKNNSMVSLKETSPRNVSSTSGGSSRSISKERRPTTKKNITFQSAGSLSAEETQPQSGTEASRTTGNLRRDKLIQAMSTPVEMDRAERMMRLMGWDGGALGVRGEGITEPIIPALHISPGAGLGHVKQKQRTVEDFRMMFLQHLLKLLQSDQTETEMQIKQVTKREGKFLNKALCYLNARNNTGVRGSPEAELCLQILEILVKKPDICIECLISNDRCTVAMFLKQFTSTPAAKPVKIKKKKPKKQKAELLENISHEYSEIEEQLHLIDTLNLQGKTNFVIFEEAVTLAYKLFFMDKIKQFLLNSVAKETIPLSINIGVKQQTYLKRLVKSVNKKTKNTYSTGLENEFYKAILDVRNKTVDILDVTLGPRTITLTKEIKKSIDTSKVVTYINNVKVTTSESDSDVVIINDNVDTILISDDDDYKPDDKAESIKIPDQPKTVNATQDKELSDVHSIDKALESIKISSPVVTPDVATNKSNVAPNITTDKTTNVTNNMPNIVTESANLLSALRGSGDGLAVNKKGDSHRIDDKDARSETIKNFGDGNDVIDGKKQSQIDSKNAGDKVLNTDKCDSFMSGDNNMRLDDNNQTAEVTFCDTVEYAELNSDSSKDEISLDVSDDSLFNDSSDSDQKGSINGDMKSELKIFGTNVVNVKKEVNTELNNNDEDLLTLDSNKFDSSNSSTCSKRTRSDSDTSMSLSKKYKGDIVRYVIIMPKNNGDTMTTEFAAQVQSVIACGIDKAHFLPLLQCHGIKNGLIYSCHDEESYMWLKKIVSSAKELDFYIFDYGFTEERFQKVNLKISVFDTDVRKILSGIELYNAGLVTEKWRLVKKEVFEGFIVITLWVDRDSFIYIRDNNFTLYAGVDRVHFSMCFV